MSLGFLSPLFLVGLLAAAVPIVLHLFRRQADTVVPFSAVHFLRRVPVEQARRRRVREMLLLALRTAALVLLALSFARPYLVDSAAAADAPVTIIAMDASLSVSTPAQVSRARTLAAQSLDETSGGSLVALLRFDERAEVVVPPTIDRSAVRSAIGAVSPGAGGTRYGAALAGAVDVAAGRPARLIVISDLQQAGWDRIGATVVRPDLEVVAHEVGDPPVNLAVVEASRTPEGAMGVVRNGGGTRRSVPVRLDIDGRTLATESVVVEPGQTATVRFTAPLPVTGVLTLRLDDEEGYAADNARFIVLDPPVRPRVLAVTGAGSANEAFYFERAIAAAEGAEGLAVDRVGMERLVAGPDVLAGYAAVVLFASSGLDRRTADALGRAASEGAGMLFVAGPALDLEQLASQLPPALGVRAGRAQELETPVSFAPVDVRHPVFRPFAPDGGLLGSVAFRRITRVQLPSDAVVLAQFANGAPALVEVPGMRGRLLLFASDFANRGNDFARHPAFVPFAHEIVRYLAATRAVERDVHVGALAGPGGQTPGVVEVPVPATSRSAAAVRRVAVNVDPRESEEARMTPSAFVAAVPRTTTPAASAQAVVVQTREAEQSWWRYGLALMLLGLAVESVVGRRT